MSDPLADFQTADDYRDSCRPARVKQVSAFGFTERQARFLVNVMVHSGVFLERQYCASAAISHGQKSHDFIAKLIARRYATAITPGRLHQGRLFHLHYKPLYEAIGEPDNRHRKPATLGRMIERLMILDAVLADRHHTWLGTERDKTRYFFLQLNGLGLRAHLFPHLTFGSGPDATRRYFPDKLPIGIEKRPGWYRHVFLYLVTRDVPMDFRLFLLRHAEVLRSLPEFTVRLLIPRRFRKATALYRYAFRDELAMPLEPATAEQLERYFRERQQAPGHLTEPADEDLAKAFRKFGAARFKALYRVWQREGDRAIWRAQSFILRDALARGTGRLECVELSRQYLQLTSLVGVA
jgi:hypothetical protein